MILTDSIKSAYNGLSTSKGRSLLTILGIVIGIMSIMIVMSLGAGAQRLILDQVDSLGSKIIFVSDSRQAGGPPQPTDALDDRDLAELRKKTNVPNARLVLASAFNSQRITFGSEAFDGAVQGITPEWERAFSLTPAQGDFISFDDVRGATKVAVIGHTVRKELFPGEDPIGQIIKVKNNSFRVIGVLPEKGQLALFGYDQSVFLPISTFQNTILNAKNYGNFLIEVDDEVNINATVEFTPASIAGGIYTKMITSAAGLIIGMLAYVGYNFLNSQIAKVTNKMEASAAEFMDILQEPTR